MLAINAEDWNGGVTVSLNGRADFEAVQPLREGLQKVALKRPEVAIIDLSQLDFIGSGGIGVLVEFRKAIVKNGGRVVIAAANEYVAHCFHLSRLDTTFEMRSSIAEAKGESPVRKK